MSAPPTADRRPPTADRRPPTADRRGLLFAGLCLACLLLASGYLLWARQRSPAAQAPASDRGVAGAADLPAPPFVLVRDGQSGALAALPLGGLDGERAAAPLACERAYFAGGSGICLVADRGLFTTYRAVLLGADLRPRHELPLQGIPSRARVSPDGRYSAVTVFVSGHSYAPGSFSTRTEIYANADGRLVGELEQWRVERDGRPFFAADFNFWGVTFAADSDRFYATLGSGGRTYLVEGSVGERRARVLREGVECPSLSPDGTRIAFKQLVKGGGWRPAVLDLATLEATVLPETRNVDDQAEWLDDGTILYAVEGDLWAIPADGSGAPRLFLAAAHSPAVVR